MRYTDLCSRITQFKRDRVGPTAWKLKLVEKTIILSVRPDSEPGDLVVLQKGDGAISEGHAGGVDGVAIVKPS